MWRIEHYSEGQKISNVIEVDSLDGHQLTPGIHPGHDSHLSGSKPEGLGHCRLHGTIGLTALGGDHNRYSQQITVESHLSTLGPRGHLHLQEVGARRH